MLIDKGFTSGEVVTLKLTSGEELIARFESEESDCYKISKTKVVGMGPNGPALMDYLFTVDPSKTIKLRKAAVTVIEHTEKGFADQYLQATTGIAL